MAQCVVGAALRVAAHDGVERSVSVEQPNLDQLVLGERLAENTAAEYGCERNVLLQVVEDFQRSQDVSNLQRAEERSADLGVSGDAHARKDGGHPLRVDPRGPQQDCNVAVAPRLIGGCVVDPFADARCDHVGLALDRSPARRITKVSHTALCWFFVVVVGLGLRGCACGSLQQMNLDRLWGGGIIDGSPGVELGLGVVFHVTGALAHQATEDEVHTFEDLRPTSEIAL